MISSRINPSAVSVRRNTDSVPNNVADTSNSLAFPILLTLPFPIPTTMLRLLPPPSEGTAMPRRRNHGLGFIWNSWQTGIQPDSQDISSNNTDQPMLHHPFGYLEAPQQKILSRFLNHLWALGNQVEPGSKAEIMAYLRQRVLHIPEILKNEEFPNVSLNFLKEAKPGTLLEAFYSFELFFRLSNTPTPSQDCVDKLGIDLLQWQEFFQYTNACLQRTLPTLQSFPRFSPRENLEISKLKMILQFGSQLRDELHFPICDAKPYHFYDISQTEIEQAKVGIRSIAQKLTQELSKNKDCISYLLKDCKAWDIYLMKRCVKALVERRELGWENLQPYDEKSLGGLPNHSELCPITKKPYQSLKQPIYYLSYIDSNPCFVGEYRQVIEYWIETKCHPITKETDILLFDCLQRLPRLEPL